MKTILFIVFFIVTNVSLFAQPLSLGVKGNVLLQNKNLDFELSPRLVLDYQFENLPFSVSGNLGFSYAELSTDIKLSSGYTKTKSCLGAIINYYPIKWDIEPYVGLGLFYNINSLSKSGNSSESIDGKLYEANSISNNVSYEVILGTKFSAKSSIHFITEVVYSMNKPSYTLKETNALSAKVPYVEYDTKFDFNALYISLGLMFDL